MWLRYVWPNFENRTFNFHVSLSRKCLLILSWCKPRIYLPSYIMVIGCVNSSSPLILFNLFIILRKYPYLAPFFVFACRMSFCVFLPMMKSELAWRGLLIILLLSACFSTQWKSVGIRGRFCLVSHLSTCRSDASVAASWLVGWFSANQATVPTWPKDVQAVAAAQLLWPSLRTCRAGRLTLWWNSSTTIHSVLCSLPPRHLFNVKPPHPQALAKGCWMAFESSELLRMVFYYRNLGERICARYRTSCNCAGNDGLLLKARWRALLPSAATFISALIGFLSCTDQWVFLELNARDFKFSRTPFDGK